MMKKLGIGIVLGFLVGLFTMVEQAEASCYNPTQYLKFSKRGKKAARDKPFSKKENALIIKTFQEIDLQEQSLALNYDNLKQAQNQAEVNQITVGMFTHLLVVNSKSSRQPKTPETHLIQISQIPRPA